eukprot:SAG31_NODE_1839_length_7124_cov_5.833310_2_plen_175_part_00
MIFTIYWLVRADPMYIVNARGRVVQLYTADSSGRDPASWSSDCLPAIPAGDQAASLELRLLGPAACAAFRSVAGGAHTAALHSVAREPRRAEEEEEEEEERACASAGALYDGTGRGATRHLQPARSARVELQGLSKKGPRPRVDCASLSTLLRLQARPRCMLRCSHGGAPRDLD